MTGEEFDLSYLLGRYGTMANLINEDFSQSIEEMENRPKSKKIKLDSIQAIQIYNLNIVNNNLKNSKITVNNWKKFINYFEKLNKYFFVKLK